MGVLSVGVELAVETLDNRQAGPVQTGWGEASGEREKRAPVQTKERVGSEWGAVNSPKPLHGPFQTVLSGASGGRVGWVKRVKIDSRLRARQSERGRKGVPTRGSSSYDPNRSGSATERGARAGAA